MIREPFFQSLSDYDGGIELLAGLLVKRPTADPLADNGDHELYDNISPPPTNSDQNAQSES